MTKKDYINLSNCINFAIRSSHEDLSDSKFLSYLIGNLDATLKAENPRYDTKRFVEACLNDTGIEISL